MKEFKKKYQDKLALASSTAEESISNMRTVRAFCNEPKLTSSYDEDIESSYNIGKLIALLGGLFLGVVSSLVYVSILLDRYISLYDLLLGGMLTDTLVWGISCLS